MGTTPTAKYEPEKVEPSGTQLPTRPSAGDRLAADFRRALLGAIYFGEPKGGRA